MTVQARVLTGVLLLAVVIATLVHLLTPDAVDEPGRDGVLELVIENYRFEPASFRIPAEEPVSLVFVNTDDHNHGVTLGRGVVEEGGRPVRFEECMFQHLDATTVPQGALIAPSEAVPCTTLSIGPNETVTLEFTAPEQTVGTWRLGCFTGPGCDYRVALSGEMTVTSAETP